jgi:hypothetical protein
MNDCPRQNPAYGRLFLSLYKSMGYNISRPSGRETLIGFALGGAKCAEIQCCRRLATRISYFIEIIDLSS